MNTFIRLYSNEQGEIKKFLDKFYEKKEEDLKSFSNINNSSLEWEVFFSNPIDMANIIGVFIDNSETYKINMWVCLDKDILINVTKHNVDDLIKYLYERFPY